MMASFMPRGTVVQYSWQETQEGREFLGGILRRNRRKVFGLLEVPNLPLQVAPDVVSYKIFLSGKPGIGKTSTVAKLRGHEVPHMHIETPGIQTSVLYWPAKLIHSQKVVMFKFQFWDCGDHAHRKFDHLLPACKHKADAAMFFFSFTDRTSFDDLPNQIDRVLEQNEKISRIAVATRFDQFLHSDLTEQNLVDFEEQLNVPVLKIANVNGPRLSDNRTLDGRAGITEVAPFLNQLAELLWQRDQAALGIQSAKTTSRRSSGSSQHSRTSATSVDLHYL